MQISTYDKTTKRYDRNAYTEGQLEYLAAYYEADGQCSFYITDSGYLGNVGIEQKDREILHLFELWFGGTITPSQRKRIWVWQIYGHQAKALLLLIRPYLKTYRKEKATRFIQFFSTLDEEVRFALITLDRLKTEFHKQRLEAPFEGNQ